MKAFADEKLNVLREFRKHCGEKGENADNQHFLLFPTMFSKLLFGSMFKVGIVWRRVYPLPHTLEFEKYSG